MVLGAKVWQSGGWVDAVAPSDCSVSDQWPGPTLNDGVNTANSTRTGFSASGHATPFTTGTYVDIDTSLSADADAITIQIAAGAAAAATDSSTFIEFGVDPTGGTTYALWATVPIGYLTAAQSPTLRIPGRITAGSRVAFRIRSAVSAVGIQAIFTFLPVKGDGFAAPVTFGADTATARGVTLTAPGALNTKGAWTEIGTSLGSPTVNDLAAITVLLQGAAGTNMNASGVLVDVGTSVGAGGVSVIIPDIYMLGQAAENYLIRTLLTYGIDVPAGSRLWGRYARANIANAVDMVLHGAPPA